MNVGMMVVDAASCLAGIVLVIAAAYVSFWWGVRSHRMLFPDPEFIRQCGVVIRTLDAFDEIADTIGRYANTEIYRFVVFKGMRYEFDRVEQTDYHTRIRANELFMKPGLVYVAGR